MKLNTIIAGLILALSTIAAVSASDFVWSSSGGDSFFSMSGDYNSIGYSQPGWGSYGIQTSPYGVQTGWSARGTSGSMGYSYQSVSGQSGLTSLSINTQGFRTSIMRGPSYYSTNGGSTGSKYFGSVAVGSRQYTPSQFYGTPRTYGYYGYPAYAPRPTASNFGTYGYQQSWS